MCYNWWPFKTGFSAFIAEPPVRIYISQLGGYYEVLLIAWVQQKLTWQQCPYSISCMCFPFRCVCTTHMIKKHCQHETQQYNTNDKQMMPCKIMPLIFPIISRHRRHVFLKSLRTHLWAIGDFCIASISHAL